LVLEEMMNIILKRRSVRAYQKDRAIEEEILKKLCEAGQWAPTPSNIQSLHFIVVDGSTEDLELLKDLSPGFPREAPAAIVITTDLDRSKNFTGNNRMILCAEEAAAAGENIALAAVSAGLGSCFVESFSKEGLKGLLNLPENVYPLLIMALGYPDENRESSRAKRGDLIKVMHWNGWER